MKMVSLPHLEYCQLVSTHAWDLFLPPLVSKAQAVETFIVATEIFSASSTTVLS